MKAISREGFRHFNKKAAIKGTILHNEAEICLKNSVTPRTPEVKSYIKYINSRPGIKHFEEYVEIGEYAGRIDCYIIHDNILEIIDFKTGGAIVYVRGNRQLSLYAKALLSKYPQITHVVLTIFQDHRPRSIKYSIKGGKI